MASLGVSTVPALNNEKVLVWRKSLLWLLLWQGICMFFFVVVPIISPLPYLSDPWLNLGDIWKIIDPLVTLPIMFWIFELGTRTSVRTSDGKERIALTTAMVICAAVYVEGHGLHTAAAMFKDPLKKLMQQSPKIKSEYPIIPELYSYMRDDWEHLYAHYLYAIGALGFSVCHMIAHAPLQLPPLSTKSEFVKFFAAVLSYAVLFAGTCINFPGGLYVGMGWLVLYALPWAFWLWRLQEPGYDIIARPLSSMRNTSSSNISSNDLQLNEVENMTTVDDGVTTQQRGWDRWGIFSRKRVLWSIGCRLVLQYYLLSYLIALLIMLGYIAKYGFQDRASAGIPLK